MTHGASMLGQVPLWGFVWSWPHVDGVTCRVAAGFASEVLPVGGGPSAFMPVGLAPVIRTGRVPEERTGLRRRHRLF